MGETLTQALTLSCNIQIIPSTLHLRLSTKLGESSCSAHIFPHFAITDPHSRHFQISIQKRERQNTLFLRIFGFQSGMSTLKLALSLTKARFILFCRALFTPQSKPPFVPIKDLCSIFLHQGEDHPPPTDRQGRMLLHRTNLFIWSGGVLLLSGFALKTQRENATAYSLVMFRFLPGRRVLFTTHSPREEHLLALMEISCSAVYQGFS